MADLNDTPLSVLEHEDGDVLIVQGNATVADIYTSDDFPCLGDPESDDPAERTAAEDYDRFARQMARQFAAAPDMLEVLKAVEWIGIMNHPDHVKQCGYCQAVLGQGHRDECKLAAAIAKAEGRNA